MRDDLKTDYEKLIEEWEKALNKKFITLDIVLITIITVAIFIILFE